MACGWRIVSKIVPLAGSTGGHFGVGYIAEKDGKHAFVKAIDFVGAIRSADPLKELAKLTAEANFERDALEFCGEKRMSKVVRLLAHEYVDAGNSNDPMQRVACLVLEFGEGDLRGKVNTIGSLRLSWILEVLRDVALAIDQLHRRGIAHQDIKPSNVVSIPQSGTVNGADMKLTDLGRVVRKGVAGPHDSRDWPGDPHYSPPERWYGFHSPDWPDEREASDAFMLGSLLFFLFTGVPLQPLLIVNTPDPFKPLNWRGGYDDALLTVLRDAQVRALADSLQPCLPDDYADAILSLAKSLTDPDPRIRGDARARSQSGRPVGIDRYHQKFRALALRAAIDERVGRI